MYDGTGSGVSVMIFVILNFLFIKITTFEITESLNILKILKILKLAEEA